jgi:hypothetical protein
MGVRRVREFCEEVSTLPFLRRDLELLRTFLYLISLTALGPRKLDMSHDRFKGSMWSRD